MWTITSFLAAVLLFAFAPVAHATTRFVSDTGTDGPNCGVTTSAQCRSITQAIELANPGDTILVGPGRYGDLNGNGILGEPGEELGYLTPPASCSCVLRIEKPVIVISSGGAAVTMIDGRSVDVIQNVFLTTAGGEFGRPGKGFTVTETAQQSAGGAFVGEGIVLDAAANVKVRGNQVIFTRSPSGVSGGTGILTVNDAAVRIEGNQVMYFDIGIQGRGAATVSKNQVIGNRLAGILATGGTVVGNVAARNVTGIQVSGSVTTTGNAAYTNNLTGFRIGPTFSGVFTKNNMFANGLSNGGLTNSGVAGLNATNNYWGATTGPGGLPANEPCTGPSPGGTTTTSPFATKPFTVKPLKP